MNSYGINSYKIYVIYIIYIKLTYHCTINYIIIITNIDISENLNAVVTDFSRVLIIILFLMNYVHAGCVIGPFYVSASKIIVEWEQYFQWGSTTSQCFPKYQSVVDRTQVNDIRRIVSPTFCVNICDSHSPIVRNDYTISAVPVCYSHLYFPVANSITHCHSVLMLLWNIIELTEGQISVSLRSPSLLHELFYCYMFSVCHAQCGNKIFFFHLESP